MQASSLHSGEKFKRFGVSPAVTVTVRDATFDVLRRLELTTIFSNPGSTEVPFLAGLPDDLTFVLALHEGSRRRDGGRPRARPRRARARAAALARPGSATPSPRSPPPALNRAPLVVVVGQQDRRHLALDPFLAGRLHGLAGEYPVYSDQPARAQDVPGAIVRAYHEAVTARGPGARDRADGRLVGARARAARDRSARSGCCARRPPTRPPSRRSPACSTAPSARDRRRRGRRRREGWTALIALAERLELPGLPGAVRRRRRASRRTTRCSPATCPRAARACARRSRPHDAVLIVGTGALRQYPYDPGPLVDADTRLAVVTQDPEEAHRSPVELAVLGEPGRDLRGARARPSSAREPAATPHATRPAAAARRASRCAPATSCTRSPSGCRATRSCSRRRRRSRPELHARIPATAPLGFISAMGMLGFALPAAIGLRHGAPRPPGADRRRRRLVALPDPGAVERGRVRASACCSSSCATAATRSWTGSPSAPAAPARGPRWTAIDIAAMARAQGCEARRDRDPRRAARARSTTSSPSCRTATTPLLLEVVVAQDETFDP